jgi:plasmid stabilization system protein ParE
MTLKISQLAFLEIEDAKEYYNLQKPTLGDTFRNDVKKSIESIREFPNLYPNITNDLKRTLLHRFPYSIFYAVTNNTILILSVAHQHRKPFYLN